METKKLYKNQKHTLYELTNILGVNHYTLYRIDSPKKVDNMTIKNFMALAEVEKIEPKKLYKEMKEYLEEGNEYNGEVEE